MIHRCDVHVTTRFQSFHWLARTHGNHAQPNLGRPPLRVCPGPEAGQGLYLCPILLSQYPPPGGGRERSGPLVIFGEVALGSTRSWESDSSRGLSLLSPVCHSLGIFSHSSHSCVRSLLCGGLCAGCWGYSSQYKLARLCHFSKMHTATATFRGW